MWGGGEDGRRGCVVFNGEVYNHRPLRSELSRSWDFRSTSDTEVLLAGLQARGNAFWQEMNSMMAVAYYDASCGTLTAARDRLGKKPLFLYQGPDIWALASEIKSFAAMGLPLTESPRSRALYHWLRHVPGTDTIYREVRRVPAGSYLSIDLSNPHSSFQERLFWDPFARCGETYSGSYDEAIEVFLHLLDDSTRLRLDSDVPVGLFLSGGIDSTLVASSIAKQHNAEITAFVFKNQGSPQDESEVAQATALQLGLKTELISLDTSDFLRQVDRVAYYYDDPCSPVSQLATMALSEAASKSVTVILTGDGGDEIFLGYPWLGKPGELWKYRKWIDRVPFFRKALAMLLSSGMTSSICDILDPVLHGRQNRKRALLLELLQVEKPEALYEHWLALWPRSCLPECERVQIGKPGWLQLVESCYPNYSWPLVNSRSLEEALAAHEMVSAMRDEILVKVDRGTMAYSLEARSPLLDYRIVEFGLSLPVGFKRKGGVTKRILRDACSQRVGAWVATLPKSGFSTSLPARAQPRVDALLRWSNSYDEKWFKTWGVSG